MGSDLIDNPEEVDNIDIEMVLDTHQKEIANLFDQLSSNIQALEHAQFLQKYVDKFGITTDTLLLLNQNQELSAFFKAEFPSCEAIEEGEVFDPASVVISEESFGEKMKSIIKSIIEFIKRIISKLAEEHDLHLAHAKLIQFRLGRVRKQYDEIQGGKYDSQAFNESEVKMLDHHVWDAATKGILSNWKTIAATNGEKIEHMLKSGQTEFNPPVNKLNSILEFFGYRVKISSTMGMNHYEVESFKSDKTMALPEDKEPVKELGWDFPKVKDGFKICSDIIDFAFADQLIKKNLADMREYNIRMIQADKQGLNGDKLWFKNQDPQYFRAVQGSLRLHSDSLIYVIRGMLKLASWFGSFANQCDVKPLETAGQQRLLN